MPPAVPAGPAGVPGGASPAGPPSGTIPGGPVNAGGVPAPTRPPTALPPGAYDACSCKSLTSNSGSGDCRTAEADCAWPAGVESAATLRCCVINEERSQDQSRDHKSENTPHGTLLAMIMYESTRDALKGSRICTGAKPGFFEGFFPEPIERGAFGIYRRVGARRQHGFNRSAPPERTTSRTPARTRLARSNGWKRDCADPCRGTRTACLPHGRGPPAPP